MTQNYHLAQINIAQGIADIDDPLMKDFIDQIDYINRLAESAEGFIWRLQTDGGDATGISAFDDPKVILNMSVWDSLESLKEYVYTGDHVEVFKQKKKWFVKMDSPSIALWWIPAGTIPSIQDGKDALDYLEKHGPSEKYFIFSKPFSQPK